MKLPQLYRKTKINLPLRCVIYLIKHVLTTYFTLIIELCFEINIFRLIYSKIFRTMLVHRNYIQKPTFSFHNVNVDTV